MRSLVLLLVLAAHAPAAQPAPILLDGRFEDWDARPVLHADPLGDAAGLDLGRLRAASDADYVYLSFELADALNLQNDNALTLYLDTDADAATGAPVHGIGAELVWTFGARSGTFHPEGSAPVPVTHADFGFLSAPTVTGDRFELGIRRDAAVGGVPLFGGAAVRLVLRDGADGDVLPDAPGGVELILDDAPRARPPVHLERVHPDHLRVLSYNVLRDGLFVPERTEPYRRIFEAVAPDVVALQEVYDHGPDAVAARMTELLPLPEGEAWHAAGVGSDVLVVSRYPVTEAVPLCNEPGVPTTCNGAFRLDLRPAFDTDLYLVVAHPPCCANDGPRQEELDLLAAHLRDRRADGTLAEGTPVVLAGDMNLVGERRQLETLLTGAIVNTDRFGEGGPPDWDGTAFADAAPPTTGLPTTATWFNDAESFWPGRLDYIVYSDAMLGAGRAFALHTPSLTDEERARYGLAPADSDVSDHLPVVADFVLAPDGLGLYLHPPVPNPTDGPFELHYELPAATEVSLHVYDMLGHVVLKGWDGPQAAGAHALALDGTDLVPGVYFCRLRTPAGDHVQRLVVTR